MGPELDDYRQWVRDTLQALLTGQAVQGEWQKNTDRRIVENREEATRMADENKVSTSKLSNRLWVYVAGTLVTFIIIIATLVV